MLDAMAPEGRPSRSTLHAAFAGTALPARDTIDRLVEVLDTRARSTTPEQQIDRFERLWGDAAIEDIVADVPVHALHEDQFSRTVIDERDQLREQLVRGREKLRADGVLDDAARLTDAIRRSNDARHEQQAKLELLKLVLEQGLLHPSEGASVIAELLSPPGTIDAVAVNGPYAEIVDDPDRPPRYASVPLPDLLGDAMADDEDAEFT